jgi:3-methyl-2-oxobutanoate hydroxymethyltransferase
MNILKLPERKAGHEKIVMVTCYDYTSARIIGQSEIDMILVGDSAAMVMHGYDTTLPIDTAMMASHVAAVRRGAPGKFIVADMPFLSYRKSLSETMDAVGELLRAGAQAVKLEGIAGNEETIHHIVQSGVPVMGHIGLTPQSVHQLGGFHVQGGSQPDRMRLKAEARECQQAGCFALVLECLPESLAAEITAALTIPYHRYRRGCGHRRPGAGHARPAGAEPRLQAEVRASLPGRQPAVAGCVQSVRA